MLLKKLNCRRLEIIRAWARPHNYAEDLEMSITYGVQKRLLKNLNKYTDATCKIFFIHRHKC